jgi:hypothetical protein
MFDVCYIGWEDKKIYKYGISANKIFDYMYSAKPIAHLFSGEGDLIAEAKCGVSIKEQDSKKIANSLLKLYIKSSEERRNMGERGKAFVLEHHTYQKITENFIDIFRTKNRPKMVMSKSTV